MAKYESRLREEKLKNRVADGWLAAFDCSSIIGNAVLQTRLEKNK